MKDPCYICGWEETSFSHGPGDSLCADCFQGIYDQHHPISDLSGFSRKECVCKTEQYVYCMFCLRHRWLFVKMAPLERLADVG